ncbi:MAG: efflux RND transporter permease subunit [Proteobacteria bacterium]|nr:efflux RND transporter permease subunit [Pseudomonadota bacterium]
MNSNGDKQATSRGDNSSRRVLKPASQNNGKRKRRGTLAWMAKNSVAANVLMLILILGGLVKLSDIRKEVFPEFDKDVILIRAIYPGASPEEVEQGVVLAIEESVRGINGVKEVSSTSREGVGAVTVKLLLGADKNQILDEVKAAVDRITSFPEDIERPTVLMPRFSGQVMSLALYGDQSPHVLKAYAEKVRDELLQNPAITAITITGLPPLEISIEVPQDNLRRYRLTIEQIAAVVKAASVEIPGGAVKTQGGSILLRTTERRDAGTEFGDIVILSMPDGSTVTLRDIAQIKDGFAETEQVVMYEGKRAVYVNIWRVGEQTPLGISAAVKKYVREKSSTLPPGINVATWFDISEWYQGRTDLLVDNAMIGLVLVFLLLGLFLEIRLALWVTMGIPISFIGSLLFLPATGISINMISLFAFIVVLGMVVDDAIIVGEAVYRKRQSSDNRLDAAILGVKEVAAPVTFAVITTIMAYAPLLFVPGLMGKFFRMIPIVVIAVLLMSLIESLFILPAHLAHSKKVSSRGLFGFIQSQQQWVSRLLEWQIERMYIPLVGAAVRHRYFTMALGVSILIATVGAVAGGRINVVTFPAIAGDIVTVTVEMPFGTAIEHTRGVQDRVLEAAHTVLSESNGGNNVSRGVFGNLGATGLVRNDPRRPSAVGTHLCEVGIYLVAVDQRDFTTEEFVRQWRQKIGEIPGVERLDFQYSTGPTSGTPINIVLSHSELEQLRGAAAELAAEVSQFTGTFDVDDGFENGEEQLDIKLRPEARALGLTELGLARQVRSAFFGAEAVRQQRGRDELRVYVRLPRSERESEYNIKELIIRTPQGGEIPLHQAAEIERGYSYTSIRRINGRRSGSVTADVDESVGSSSEIMTKLRDDIVPRLLDKYPGLQQRLGGDALEMAEAMGSLGIGFLVAIMAMFALLAIAVRSYLQPLIVILVIPFGTIGAVYGHMLMGYSISLMSMMGIVALAGVVVNDSLVLIVSVNRLRAKGTPVLRAVVTGSAVRFRPIILTSLTTFFGLAPMIFETSVQARVLVPMAISLGFGVIFATFITLLIVPAAYMIMDDAKRFSMELLPSTPGTGDSEPADVALPAAVDAVMMPGERPASAINADLDDHSDQFFDMDSRDLEVLTNRIAEELERRKSEDQR